MLHQESFNTSNVVSYASADRLSIDQILARHQARLDERIHQFPPDFTHGFAQLGEIYNVLGARWVEDALFLEEFFDEEGELVAWSAAWFDDQFLSIEQAVRDEEGEFEARLIELKSAHRRVIELIIDKPDRAKSPENASRLAMRCALGRLLELERHHLGVARDKSICDTRAIYSQREEILQDSRTNLMSLICLCARLAD